MYRIFLFALTLLFATVVSNADAQTRKQNMTVMSYNIRHGEGIDNKTDYLRTAHVISSQHPDMVALQEVDSVTSRSNGHDVLLEVANATGMYPTFARAISFEGGSYGVGILTKTQPISTTRIALPGREEARVLLVVELPDYYFACTHLSLTTEDQMASIATIKAFAETLNKPLIIAGDWNAHPDDAFMSDIQQYVTVLDDMTTKSFPADSPNELLDYIAIWKSADTSFKLKTFKVVDEPIASDHRPVVAKFKLCSKQKKQIKH